MTIDVAPFGEGARLFTLRAGGVRADFTDFGAALVSLYHPDGTDVVLGFDDVSAYRADTQFMGVIVGRYANRIAGGRFTLSGHIWSLPCNDGANHLHGGPDGFGKRLWNAHMNETENAVTFTLSSPHLDQGYPGSLTARARYCLSPDGCLRLSLRASTDRPTIVNLAPHAYFNLAGGHHISGHRLRLHCDFYTLADETRIPTGAITKAAGTPYDFRSARSIPLDVDDNFVINGAPGTLRPVAEISDSESGRELFIHATTPGVQIYCGQHLNEGGSFPAHAGLCVEPQYFPDSPNQPGFAIPAIDTQTDYSEDIEYRFGRGDGSRFSTVETNMIP